MVGVSQQTHDYLIEVKGDFNMTGNQRPRAFILVIVQSMLIPANYVGTLSHYCHL